MITQKACLECLEPLKRLDGDHAVHHVGRRRAVVRSTTRGLRDVLHALVLTRPRCAARREKSLSAE